MLCLIGFLMQATQISYSNIICTISQKMMFIGCVCAWVFNIASEMEYTMKIFTQTHEHIGMYNMQFARLSNSLFFFFLSLFHDIEIPKCQTLQYEEYTVCICKIMFMLKFLSILFIH